jgi:hypothetical protein
VAAHLRLSLEAIRGRAAYDIPQRRRVSRGHPPDPRIPIFFRNAMPGEGIHPIKEYIHPNGVGK